MEKSAETLVNASLNGDFLSLNPGQVSAVGRVFTGEGEVVCSGVLIDSDRVLTASHCVVEEGTLVELGEELLEGARLIAVNADEDLALVSVAPQPHVIPIPLIAGSIDENWVGSSALMAGFGLTEDGELATKARFLVEKIVRVTETVLEVDAEGRSGACLGDSGGPLLARDNEGTLRVLGALVAGTASCLGVDKYARGDRIRAWASEVDPRPEVSREGCDGLTAIGICRRDHSMYCEGGTVVAERCEAANHCGWAAKAAGFRCVGADDDLCQGVGDTGDCDGDKLRRCDAGVLTEQRCSSCEVCLRNASGMAACGAP